MSTRKKAEPKPMTLDQMGPKDLASLFAMAGLLASIGPEVIPNPAKVVDVADWIADEWVKRRTG